MIDDQRWRDTYDAWKLASPYDDDVDPRLVICFHCGREFIDDEPPDCSIGDCPNIRQLPIEADDERLTAAPEFNETNWQERDRIASWDFMVETLRHR